MVLEALKNHQTLAEPALKFDVNAIVISRWKSEFLENMAAAFEKKEPDEKNAVDPQELYAQIGQLKEENEYLKKTAGNWKYYDRDLAYKTKSKWTVRSSAM